MSNPPFFASQSEALGANTTRTDKRPKPTSLSTAAQHESQTTGGEVYFTFKLAKETLQYKDRIGFATVMLGKKSSVKTLKKMLEKLGIKNYSSYEFCQGRVMRWGLAWTFRQDVTFPVSEFKTKRKLFKPMTFPIIKEEIVVTKYTDESVLCWLKEELLSLDMKVLEQKNKSDIGGFHLLVKAFKNNWIGARRRRRALNQKQNDPETMKCEDTAMMVDNGNCQEETEGEEPFAKRPRCELTEEQVDESSAWNCSGLIEESTSKRPILSFTVHVNIENSPALISEALNGSESDLDCSDDQGGDEGKSKSSVEPRLLASFTLVNEHHSKDVLYQLITYIKNRIKKPVGGD